VSWPKVISSGEGLNANLSAGISTVAARISSLRPIKAFRANVATLLAGCAKDGLHHKVASKKVHASFFIKKI
jgi:hypothetical protein